MIYILAKYAVYSKNHITRSTQRNVNYQAKFIVHKIRHPIYVTVPLQYVNVGEYILRITHLIITIGKLYGTLYIWSHTLTEELILKKSLL